MHARFFFFLSLIFSSTIAHAEYYLVTECNGCNTYVTPVKHHRVKHVSNTHKAPVKTQRTIVVKKHHSHHQEYCDGFCANGHYIGGGYYREYSHEAFPHYRDKGFNRNYENYNNDLATGDDDTYKNSDMQIN